MTVVAAPWLPPFGGWVGQSPQLSTSPHSEDGRVSLRVSPPPFSQNPAQRGVNASG